MLGSPPTTLVRLSDHRMMGPHKNGRSQGSQRPRPTLLACLTFSPTWAGPPTAGWGVACEDPPSWAHVCGDGMVSAAAFPGRQGTACVCLPRHSPPSRKLGMDSRTSSGLLLIARAVLPGQVLGFGGIVPVATIIGVLAGLVQILGLLRWVYVVPAARPRLRGPDSRARAARGTRRRLPCPAPVPRSRRRRRRAPWLPLHRHLVSVDRRRCYPGNGAPHLAGVARGRHRRRVGGRLGGVPRSLTKSGDGVWQERRSQSSTSRGPSGCSRWV